MKKFNLDRIQSLRKILAFLRVRTSAAGLEVSDQVARFVSFNGKTWQMAAIRFEPGTMEKGKIKNREAAVASFRALREKIVGPKEKKKLNVVVAVSSVPIYSQSFSLPVIDGDELDKAVGLNVQMLSPVDFARVYAGSQILDRDEQNLKLNMSAAFIDRETVDGLVAALFEAGFVAVGMESRPLALLRILRERGTGIDTDKSYLLVNIDNSGIDFLIVRKGQLYFEYSNQWADLMDPKGEVSLQKFEETLASSLRQVTNFYGQHWREPLAAVILSAAAFEDPAEAAIRAAATLPVIRLTLLMGQPISSEWLVALGASIRGFRTGARDKEINLLGEDAEETFREEQLIGFMRFWRLVLPIAFALLLLTFGLADVFLSRTKAGIEAESVFSVAQSQIKAISDLQASSTAFNADVALVQSVEQSIVPRFKLIDRVNGLAASSSVTIAHLSFQGAGTPIFLTGTAGSQDSIVALKTLFEADPHFGPVDLPLTAIHPSNNIFSFSMNVPLSGAPF